MDNQVRIFRENPIAWWDKEAMRHLRRKYGKDKKKFSLLRSVYLALCEIESDFTNAPINAFTQTVGTYAGASRQVAGKYINLLGKEGLISKTRQKDTKTKKFLSGTTIKILSFQSKTTASEPLAGYPTNGVSHQRGTPPSIKNISIDKKLSINNNVNDNLKTFKTKRNRETVALRDILMQYGLKRRPKPQKPDRILERDYLAQEIADKLTDQKSLGCFRVIAEKIPQTVIFEVLGSVKETANAGKIRESRGALFVEIMKRYADGKGIELGFKQ